MEHTLEPEQYVLVDKLTPRFDPYNRGDIVVFNPPVVVDAAADGTPFIKRVIGVGGDTVEIKDDGSVCVNGTKLDRAVPVRRRRAGPADRRVQPGPLGRARRASCS